MSQYPYSWFQGQNPRQQFLGNVPQQPFQVSQSQHQFQQQQSQGQTPHQLLQKRVPQQPQENQAQWQMWNPSLPAPPLAQFTVTVFDPAIQQWLAAGHSPDSFITAVRLMHQHIYGSHNYGSKAVRHSIEAVCHTLKHNHQFRGLFPPQLQWTDQEFDSLKYAGIGKVLDKKEKKAGQTYEQYFASI